MTVSQAGKWLGVIVAGSTLAVGAVGTLSYIFATKQELINVEKSQVEAKAESRLRDYRIQRLEVQVQNVGSVTSRTDKNVERLLRNQRIPSEPEPMIRPLPTVPSPDSLKAKE